MAERHDGSYRLLFSHVRMVEDLLRGFVRLEEIPPGGMERRSEVQLSERLDRREQDLVWVLRGARGEPAFYLFLEFQSAPDPRMELRISVYTGLLRQDLLRGREIPRTGEPPPVLAVVLYNGRRRWRGSPGDAYRLIDMRRDPLPAGDDNLVAALCELERCRTPEELTGPVEMLARLLAGPDMADLRRAFLAFLRRSLIPNRFPEARIDAILELEEVRPMLRETVRQWTEEWKTEGLKLGRQEGRREGEITLLVRQLELKFGPLSSADRERIEAAGSDRLLSWGERILTARSLAEVFGE